MIETTPHRPALPHPGPQAGQETHVRALALSHLPLLAWLMQLLGLLARHHPTLAARLYATLPAQSSWQHQSWGLSEDPDALDASGAIALALARLLYVFGPKPRRGMRALPNRAPMPRLAPPIRPPPRPSASPPHRESAENPATPGRPCTPIAFRIQNSSPTPLRAPPGAASLTFMRNPATSPISRFWYRWYYTPAV